MSIKKIFIVDSSGKISVDYIEYNYCPGFSKIQKQKSILSLKNAIWNKYSQNNLEISSSSVDELGSMMSALNLCITIEGKKISVENIYQASKVFENGGPYYEILEIHPKKAKKTLFLYKPGKLTGFNFFGYEFPISPNTFFYNYLYCWALWKNKININKLNEYSIFSDIEFNHNKSINCQAYATAVFVSLYRKNLLNEAMKSVEDFYKIVYESSLVDS